MVRRHGRQQARILRLFGRDTRGVVAIEFAFICLPFLALLFASLEGALVFWTNQALDEAVAQASRTLYTGSFQMAAEQEKVPAAQIPDRFKNLVCSRFSGLVTNCSEIKIDVQTYKSFPNGVPQPIVEDPVTKVRKVDPAFGQFLPPGPSEITLVRAVIEYPVYASLLGGNSSNLTATTRLLMATAAFRTEQFK